MRTACRSNRNPSWRTATSSSSARAPATSTPVGPPPTTTKVSSPSSTVAGVLVCCLEAAEDVVAQAAGVGQRVERKAVLGRPRDAEEVGRGAAGHDERVEGEAVSPSPGWHPAAVPVDPGHRGEVEADVVGLAEDGPDRIGHVARLEPGRGHLVQERLEGVEVALVDDGHVDRLTDEGPGGGQAGEARADDHHAVHRPMLAQPSRGSRLLGRTSGRRSQCRRLPGSVTPARYPGPRAEWCPLRRSHHGNRTRARSPGRSRIRGGRRLVGPRLADGRVSGGRGAAG